MWKGTALISNVIILNVEWFGKCLDDLVSVITTSKMLTRKLACDETDTTVQDVIPLMEAQATESAYVWTNSKNVHLDWDPAALYFDARDNQHYGQMVNDSWSEAGNNCIIKWNTKRRRVEV